MLSISTMAAVVATHLFAADHHVPAALERLQHARQTLSEKVEPDRDRRQAGRSQRKHWMRGTNDSATAKRQIRKVDRLIADLERGRPVEPDEIERVLGLVEQKHR
jgi:hypothetical protein